MTKKKEVTEEKLDVKDEDIQKEEKPATAPIQEQNKAWRVANGIQ